MPDTLTQNTGPSPAIPKVRPALIHHHSALICYVLITKSESVGNVRPTSVLQTVPVEVNIQSADLQSGKSKVHFVLRP